MKVLMFGICRDIAGEHEVEVEGVQSVGELKQQLVKRFPEMTNLASLSIAVDNSYANDDRVLNGGEEIAIIPPVSGG